MKTYDSDSVNLEINGRKITGVFVDDATFEITGDDEKRIEDFRAYLKEEFDSNNCMSGELLTCAFLLSKLDQSNLKVKEAKEALEFYADKNNYVGGPGKSEFSIRDCDCSERGGKRARETLEKLK